MSKLTTRLSALRLKKIPNHERIEKRSQTEPRRKQQLKLIEFLDTLENNCRLTVSICKRKSQQVQLKQIEIISARMDMSSETFPPQIKQFKKPHQNARGLALPRMYFRYIFWPLLRSSRAVATVCEFQEFQKRDVEKQASMIVYFRVKTNAT